MTAKQTLEATERMTLMRQVEAALRRAAELHDPEAAHLTADVVLVAFLVNLGYSGVAELYNRVRPKWYSRERDVPTTS